MPVEDLFDLQRALVEELLHEGVVALGDHLDQRFVRVLSGLGKVGRDVALFALAIAIGRVGVGLHTDEVDHTFEFALGADGDLDGDGGAAEVGLHTFEGAIEGGALAIELINNDGAGELEIVGERPDFFGLDFDAGHAIDQDEGGIGGNEGRASVVNKDVVAGSIEDVDFGFFPLGERRRRWRW